MTCKEVRKKFLEYFQKLNHNIYHPAPLLNKNDPSLMFTNSGMNQFKSYFLGDVKPKFNRITDSQPCLRISGKHNDLEEVGKDTYHHTLFEMLGNWSFGDSTRILKTSNVVQKNKSKIDKKGSYNKTDNGPYFKEDAIKYSWKLLTEIYKIPKENLYVTVFEGSKEDNIEADNEAAEIWEKYIKKERIIFCPKKDNFWDMGAIGPCGPCSEIHVDIRSSDEKQKIDAKNLVNKDHPLVIEIWNLVFIQYKRTESGKLEKLSQQHIDTGMGLERLCMVLQNKKSTYDTDIFQPLINKLLDLTKVKREDFKIEALKPSSLIDKNKDDNVSIVDIALRVVVDHIRAIVLVVSEGVMPSNTGEGYVVRRILRRAVRYGYSYLNLKEPFLYKLVSMVVTQFKDLLPDIEKQELYVSQIIKGEEQSFLKTLGQGIHIMEGIISDTLSNKTTDIKIKKDDAPPDNLIPGKIVFELYDRYGFPPDLTRLIAKEHSLDIDEEGFNKAMQKQKSQSKLKVESSDWVIVDKNQKHKSKFVGYKSLVSKSKILKYQKIDKEGYRLVLDKTPFYPEGGGQVGDVGSITCSDIFTPTSSEKVSKNCQDSIKSNEISNDSIYAKHIIKVVDTKKENDNIVVYVDKLPPNPDKELLCSVDTQHRNLSCCNHTATHILHAVLKQTLGKHVSQKGSLVNAKILRFDFSHFNKLSVAEIYDIEAKVNEKIRSNIPLTELVDVDKEEAIKMGANALFGEKYGEKVRVIVFDKNFSLELCGGTHVKATGVIGYLKIISETSVAAGIRRIEAVTAAGAERYINSRLSILESLNETLKNPKDPIKSLNQVLENCDDLKKQVSIALKEQMKNIKEDLKQQIKKYNNINVLCANVSLHSTESLKQLSFELLRQHEPVLVILLAKIGENPHISVIVSDILVKEYSVNASNIIKELAKEIKGGGGGQQFFATAGGKDLKGLKKAMLKAQEICSKIL